MVLLTLFESQNILIHIFLRHFDVKKEEEWKKEEQCQITVYTVGVLLLIKGTEFLYAIMFIVNWSMITEFTMVYILSMKHR